MQSSSPSLTEAIRRTLARMEEASFPDDPKVAEIKRRALLRLAELQRRGRRRRQKMLLVAPGFFAKPQAE